MIDLPSPVLRLLDATGQPFGQLRVVAHASKPHAECIFDVPADPAATARPEVRWACKRHYRRFSEHRLQILDDGSLVVSKSDFRWVLTRDDDGGYRSVAPAPPVRAAWASEG